VNETEPGVI